MSISFSDKYEVSESLMEIGMKVIEENENLQFIADNEISICYMYSSEMKKSKGKIVFADTELIKEKFRDLIGYQFCITFYKPNTEEMTDEAIERLMYHELRHIGYDDVKEKCFIVPHDIEDFRDVVDAWGLDWATH